MKIAFIVYHDVLDDRLVKILEELKIDSFTKWERVIGKFHGSEGHLGTPVYPGHNSVRMVPFEDEKVLKQLIPKIQEFNKNAVKKDDILRVFLLPLEQII